MNHNIVKCLQMPFSDGSKINFSRYYNSQTPGLPPVAPPLDAVVVEAKQQRQGKAVVFPSNANVNSQAIQATEEPEDAIVVNGNRYFELQIGETDKSRILYTFDQSAFVEPKSRVVYVLPMNPYYFLYGK